VREVAVFGVVGVVATLTHYFCAIFAIERLARDVLEANFFAYCVAVGVSFAGHSLLTFRATMTYHRFLKFVVVSLSALAVSQALLWVLTIVDLVGHRINMVAVVCVVPCYSYVLNRFWVYQ
jgi:putative flippase GtrA